MLEDQLTIENALRVAAIKFLFLIRLRFLKFIQYWTCYAEDVVGVH